MKLSCTYMAHLTGKVNLNDERSRLRASMFWGLAEFIHTLDVSGMWMTRDEIRRAQNSGYVFLLAYQKALLYFERGWDEGEGMGGY